MTPHGTDDRDTDGVAQYLASLPSAAPRAGVGDLLIDRHLRRQRLRRWAPLALAAGMLVAACIESLVSIAERSPPPSVAAVTGYPWVEIRALDRRLQTAYVEGSSDARLQQLWRQREAAIRQIGDTGPNVRQVRL